MANKIIIDVTQLVHWPGHLAGIPRVIDEISERYANNSQAVFVTWDKNSNNYLEVDLTRTRQIRGSGIAHIKKDGTTFDPTANLARGVATKAQNSSLGRTGVKVLKKIRNHLIKPTQATSNFRSVTPGDGDVILVIWGEWQDQTFIDMLKASRNNGSKLVQVVHDMLPIVAPQFSGSGGATETLPIYNQNILPISTLILAVSNNTKKDVEAWLKLNKLTVPPIKVFRNGDDLKVEKAEKPHEPAFTNSGLKGQDYILCVGTIEARKNHTLLYYAWKQAQTKNIKLPRLVIVGRLGWQTENIYQIMKTDPDIKNQFVFLHEASDAELEWLYGNCLFSIYPSFYEGWGIPIAESARRGVPVIASNTSSMPEIAGDLIQYFSPYSSSEVLTQIIKLLDKNELNKAKKLLLQYKSTSWDDSYQQVDKYLKELYEQN